jgi:hypothetical protein
MMDKTLKVLNDILTDIAEEKLFFESLEDSFDVNELKEKCKELSCKVFSIDSKLVLFDQLKDKYFKNSDFLLNYFIHESRALLIHHNLKEYIKGRWKKELDSYDERELSSAESYSNNYFPERYMLDRYNKELNKVNSIQEIKIIQEKILSWYAQDIDMLAYSSLSIQDLKFNEIYDIPPYEESDPNFEMWIDGSITLDSWRQFPNTGFLFFMTSFFTEKHIINANKYQLKLYNQALDIELNSLKNNISNSPLDVQKVNIARQLSLIQKFTLGNFSDLDFQRISQIIVFNRPNEVILAYDDIIRFDIYNYDKILPYDGYHLKKSPRLVADILIKYEQFLIEQSVLLEQSDNKELPKIINKPKPNNFDFNKRKKLQVLIDVLNELNLKYDLIENDVDDLINVLTHNDYTTIPFTIKISGQTNIFTYILKEIVFCFSNLTGKSIQNSGRFITKKEGKPLLASNFNKSAKILKEYKKEEIDKILIKLKE